MTDKAGLVMSCDLERVFSLPGNITFMCEMVIIFNLQGI